MKCVRMHGAGSPKIRTDTRSRLRGGFLAVGMEENRMFSWKVEKRCGNSVEQWSVR